MPGLVFENRSRGFPTVARDRLHERYRRRKPQKNENRISLERDPNGGRLKRHPRQCCNLSWRAEILQPKSNWTETPLASPIRAT